MKDKISELEAQLQAVAPNNSRRVVERTDLLNSLAWELRSSDPSRALAYAEEAYSLADNSGYVRGAAYGLLNVGIARRYLADYETALSTLLKALPSFLSIDDLQGRASTLNWVGNVYFRMGNYPNALDYYLKSSVLSNELNDTQQTASCLTNIGRVYYALGDYTNSLLFHLRSLKLREAMADRREEAMVIWDISRTYYGMGEYDNALAYCRQSLTIRRSINDTRGMAASLHVLGDIYEKRGDSYRALLNYHRSLVAVRAVDEKYGEAMTNSRIGALYTKLHKHDQALPFLEYALELGRQIKAHEVEYNTHRVLSELYRNTGDYQKALEHFEMFYARKEEVTDKQNQQMLQNLQRGYEIEKAQREAEIYRLKNVELADALQEVQILNENLAHVNIHLEALNREKNEFLGIVAHDLQNPLAGISMTASLVKTYIEKMAPQDVRQHMEKVERTIDRMKEIIVNLLDINAIESGTLHLAPEVLDLAALAHSVLNDYSTRARSKNIEISCETVPPVFAWADRQATMQILDNLVSNAVKYSPFGSRVWVSVFSTGTVARVEVRDEGPGLTSDDMKIVFGKFARLSARPTGGEDSTGLGLSIVKKLAEAMNGSVYCISTPGCGATFTTEFPLPHNGVFGASTTPIDASANTDGQHDRAPQPMGNA